LFSTLAGQRDDLPAVAGARASQVCLCGDIGVYTAPDIWTLLSLKELAQNSDLTRVTRQIRSRGGAGAQRYGRVLNLEGEPVGNAEVEVW
jgi:hypothetical protein